MGLIKAAMGAQSGQWKEYFCCDGLTGDVLAARAHRHIVSGAGTQDSDTGIKNGSGIVVQQGQCVLIVAGGQVLDICAEPGQYIYDDSATPSLFAGDLAPEVQERLRVQMRFSQDSSTGNRREVYSIHTGELSVPYCQTSSTPFRVVEPQLGIKLDAAISCVGEYRCRIADPLVFFTRVCGYAENCCSREGLERQLTDSFLTVLPMALARLEGKVNHYAVLPEHSAELTEEVKKVLSDRWRDFFGIEIDDVTVASVKADEESEAMLRKMEKMAVLTDPAYAAAQLMEKQAAAMKMAMAESAQPADTWLCSCGARVSGKFCMECGAKKPEPRADEGWTCPGCGAVNQGKFCVECGTKKPEAKPAGWICSCGTLNKGRFCTECGAQKPPEVVRYKCSRCGWEPEDPTKAPRFCPECGDPFGDEDIR